MADDQVFFGPPSSSSNFGYDGDDMLEVGIDDEDAPVRTSALQLTSLSNLPTIREARQSFLFYICRHGPKEAECGGKMLYKNILMNNVSHGKDVLELDLSQLVQAHNTHVHCYRQQQGGDKTASPARRAEGLQRDEASSDNRELVNLTLYMGKGALGRLYVALRQRPLWYLKELEDVCKDLVKQENLKIVSKRDEEVPDIQLLLTSSRTRPLNLRQLTVSYQEQLVVVPGIVIQASFPQPKLTQAALQCRYCDHRHTVIVPATKDKLIMPRLCIYNQTLKSRNREGGRGMGDGVDGGLEDGSDMLGCSNAKDPYIILPNDSTFTDVQSLKLQEYPESVPVGDVPRSMMLNASGYNCGELRPGERVNVHGVLANYNPQGDAYEGETIPYIHVLRYEKMAEDHSQEMSFSVAEQIEFSRMAANPDIHQKIFRSIAPALYGLDEVKKAVACVLFGGVQKQAADQSLLRGDINMLMLGDPSVAKSQVLKFATRAASISVYTSGKGSSAAGLTASVIRDRHGVFALEGGAMVLADGGVVCIDEFDKMRDEDIVAMHEAMEQQTISINKAGISTMLNARCAVMAAANPTFGSYDDSQDTSEQHEMKSTILSRFDVIFMLRDKQDVERDAAMARHILALHEGASKVFDGDIPLDKLRRYISYAKQTCSPSLSAAACEKLRTFYVKTRSAAREDKRSSTKKIPITLRQLESLYRLSEGFAKMQLAKEAGESHVDMAIDLFTASTVETSKQTLVFESMTPSQQRAVQQAEEAVLGLLQPGQRGNRSGLFKNLQQKGFDRTVVARALSILVKRGTLQERADRSLRRV